MHVRSGSIASARHHAGDAQAGAAEIANLHGSFLWSERRAGSPLWPARHRAARHGAVSEAGRGTSERCGSHEVAAAIPSTGCGLTTVSQGLLILEQRTCRDYRGTFEMGCISGHSSQS